MSEKQYNLIYLGLNEVFGIPSLRGQKRVVTTALGMLLLSIAPVMTRCQNKAPSHDASKVSLGSTDPGQTIPLYLSTNRMLVMLRIGGIGPFPVVFDTGTDGNVLDLTLSNKLGLPNRLTELALTFRATKHSSKAQP